jgi:hypothetical protein
VLIACECVISIFGSLILAHNLTSRRRHPLCERMSDLGREKLHCFNRHEFNITFLRLDQQNTHLHNPPNTRLACESFKLKIYWISNTLAAEPNGWKCHSPKPVTGHKGDNWKLLECMSNWTEANVRHEHRFCVLLQGTEIEKNARLRSV